MEKGSRCNMWTDPNISQGQRLKMMKHTLVRRTDEEDGVKNKKIRPDQTNIDSLSLQA